MNEFEEKNLLRALENINRDYKTLLTGKEYKLGKKIYGVIHGLKSLKFSELHKKIRREVGSRKTEKLFGKQVGNVNVDREIWNRDLHLYNSEKRVVVYSCISGGYDNVIEPYYNAGIDYVMFTDEDNVKSSIWKIRAIPPNAKSMSKGTMLNRYLKLHPYELFSGEYDYAIYIDGNVKVVSDIRIFCEKINPSVGISMHRHVLRDCIYEEATVCKILGKGSADKLDKQVLRYKQNGFPEHFGMLEGTVIVSDLNNTVGHDILEKWWNEFYMSESLRDQLSLPYVLWKNGYSIDQVGTLGNNVYDNTKLQITPH